MAVQNTQGFALGAYLGNPNGSSASGEAAFEANYNSFTSLMGEAPTFLDNYVDYSQTMNNWVSNAGWQAWSDAQSPDARGMTPVIALPLASIASGSESSDAQYREVASGADDSVFRGIVQQYAQNGYSTLVFRPGWEMNIEGNTYAGDTAQDQADWVGAYQRVYTVLHQEASALGINVTVVWNPSTTNYTSANALTNLYPGDAYVDQIGIDVYSDMHPYSDGNNANGQATYHDWDTGGEDTSVAQFIADPVNRAHYWSHPAATRYSLDGSTGHSNSFDQIVQFAAQHGKTLSIPETGAGNSSNGSDVSDDGAFPQWLSGELLAAQAQGVKLGFVALWDSNGGGNYEFSNASDGKPQEAAAWAKYFGASAAANTGTTQPAPTTTAPSPVTLGSGHDAIVLTVAEDAWQGDAQYTVSVDGRQVGGTQTATASHAAGQGQRVTLLGDWGDGTHTVAVNFLNDAWGGTNSTDRNLYVTAASYNGTDAKASLSLMAGGTQSLTVGSAAPGTTTIGSGSDTVSLKLAEDAYGGDAQFTVSVDGKQVGGTQTAVASQSAGQTQVFNVLGNWGAGQHTVAINFLNDSWGGTALADRNLYLDGASYDGTDAHASLSLMGGGAQSVTVGSAAPAATTIGSGADTIGLQIAEDAYQGNAQFTVSVDGRQAGGTQTASASQAAGKTQLFNVLGNWGTGQHTVSINFLNDAWGGTDATDRNLYLDGISYDGAKQAQGTLALKQSGAQSVTVTSANSYTLGSAGGSVTTGGNDTVVAGTGAATVTAIGPSVSVTGGSGTLVFNGGSGNDTISAGSGAAAISGGADTLTFIAGSGKASITAGTGKEVFDIVAGKAGGALTVAGFNPGLDSVHLQGYAGSGLLSQAVTGGSTVITLTDHTTVTLTGVTNLSSQRIFS